MRITQKEGSHKRCCPPGPSSRHRLLHKHFRARPVPRLTVDNNNGSNNNSAHSVSGVDQMLPMAEIVIELSQNCIQPSQSIHVALPLSRFTDKDTAASVPRPGPGARTWERWLQAQPAGSLAPNTPSPRPGTGSPGAALALAASAPSRSRSAVHQQVLAGSGAPPHARTPAGSPKSGREATRFGELRAGHGDASSTTCT